MLIEIKNDVYFILSRLKSIDENYQIFYNTERKVFEIHNKGQIGSSYSLTVPYSTLDKRTINYVLKTRVENCKNIFNEIEKHNSKIEMQAQKEMMRQAESVMRKL